MEVGFEIGFEIDSMILLRVVQEWVLEFFNTGEIE